MEMQIIVGLIRRMVSPFMVKKQCYIYQVGQNRVRQCENGVEKHYRS